MHVPFGKWDVLLRFQIELRGVRVAPPHAFHAPRVGLDVNHVADLHVFFAHGVVNRGIQFQLLGAFHGFQAYDDVAHDFAVPPPCGLRLLRGQLRDFAFVHFLVFLDPQPDRASKVFHQNLGLFHLRGVHLRPHHRAERNLGAQLLRDAQRKRGLPGTRRARHQKRPSSHLLPLDHIHHDPTSLPRVFLPHPPRALLDRIPRLLQTEALDVRVRRHALFLRRGLHLFDLHPGT
mmetsp:Transcript_8854/g.29507  ORF Transcript_8854/g.29507 Transcript_8854/m.29507 type:complete len:233 (+) Transcript_8854:762-1460(+)